MKPPCEPSDAALVTQVAAGSDPALGELYRRHHLALFQFLRRLGASAPDAEDACQETFLRVRRYAQRFDGRARFRPWLFRIAANERSRIRSRAPLVHLEIERAEPPDERVVVLEALGRLAPRDREIIVLARFHFSDQGELAQALGISPNAARTRLSRALARLERILEAP